MKKRFGHFPFRKSARASPNSPPGPRVPSPIRRNAGLSNVGPVSIPRTPASMHTKRFFKVRTNPSSLSRLPFGHNRNPPPPPNGPVIWDLPLCGKSLWTPSIGLGPNSTPPQPLKASPPFPLPPHGRLPRLPLQVAMPRIILRMPCSGPANFPVRYGKKPWNRFSGNGHAGIPPAQPTG